MKWLVGVVGIALLVAAALAATVVATAVRADRPVGFQVARVTEPGAAPLTVAIWYPTTARPRPTTLVGFILMDVAPNAPVSGSNLPLVVISHGNGGGPVSHADTAMSLAAAGFVVAAPMHTGDNYADQSAVGSRHWLSDRSRHVRATVDHLLTRWPNSSHIAPQRVGVFGFSAGALTALTAIGAEPDLSLIASHCATAPEFVCDLLRSARSELLNQRNGTAPTTFDHEPRIGAAVVAAPGLGFTLSASALSRVTAPVQLWSGDKDTNVPYASNAAPVRAALGPQIEFHSVPGASHFSFLAPCGPIGPPALCRDAKDFNRSAFHRTFNAQIISFFQAKLPPAPQAPPASLAP
jgi:predicted dienelactone hydrolase